MMLDYEQDSWLMKQIETLEPLCMKTSHLFTGNIHRAIKLEYPVEYLKKEVWDSLEDSDISYEAATRIVNELETIKMLAEFKEFFEICENIKFLLDDIMYQDS